MLLNDEEIDDELVELTVPLALADNVADDEVNWGELLLDDKETDNGLLEELIGPLALDDEMTDDEVIWEEMLLDDVDIDEELVGLAPLALDDDERDDELVREELLVNDDGEADRELLEVSGDVTVVVLDGLKSAMEG